MKDFAQAFAAIGMCAVGVWALIEGHSTAGSWIIIFGICCLFGDDRNED